MYKILRKYNRQMMAIFAVFLMIAFVATLGPKGGCADHSPGALEIGKIGSTPVTRNAVAAAEDELRFLTQNVVVMQADRLGQTTWQPLIGVAGFSERAYSQMREHPEMYYLLLDEARRMGLSPNLAQARQLLDLPVVAVLTRDGRRVPIKDLDDELLRDTTQYHVANMLMVMSAFQRAVDSVKISEPMVRHEQAMRQTITVRAVDFQIKDYETKVPAPTEQQLAEQFKKHAAVEPGTQIGDSNPFGFGYKYPNRVKLQYVCVPRAEVRKAVRELHDEHRWKVDAVKYYDQHLNEFPATAPAPTTQEAFGLGPTSPTAPRPTTQPLDDKLIEQIINKLVDQQADVLQRKLVSDLVGRMATDFEKYHSANPTTAPSGDPFEKFAYLQSIATDIQNRNKVTLRVVSAADSLKTPKDLRDLPGIGRIPAFPDYATTLVQAFIPATQKNVAGVLSLFQASKPLTEQETGDQYIFRITAADPSHAPASIEEVKSKVEEDWKRLQAFEMAKADAARLVDAAKGKGLAAVAGDRKVYTLGPINAGDPNPIRNYVLSIRGQIDFVTQAYKLLSQLGGNQTQHPLSVIELPSDSRVAAVELVDVEPLSRPGNLAVSDAVVVQGLRQNYAQEIAERWYDYDSIVQRTGFQDETRAKTASAE